MNGATGISGTRVWQVVGVLALLLVASAQPALACPACFGAMGETESPMAEGMNNGILVLLGVVGVVQGGFAAFFVALWRRQKRRRERKESFDLIDGGIGLEIGGETDGGIDGGIDGGTE